MTSRLDVNFWRNEPFLSSRLRQSHYPLVALGKIVSEEPEYGSGARATDRHSSSQPHYIRITDFGDDGIEANHEFAAPDPIEESCRLELNDLLFARSGTVGKTYLHEDDSVPAIFAGYCIRFRFNISCALPRFVYWFTKTRIYELWVQATQRPAVQPNINKEEYKTLELPLPSDIATQQDLVAAMDAARASRRAKLAEADALLAGLDDFLLSTLGLTPPPKDERKVFAISANTVSIRLDPYFYSPELTNNLRMLIAANAQPLGSLISFSDEVWKPARHDGATFRYIEISKVSPTTGEAQAEETLVTEAPSRARMMVRNQDIIVSLTRPHHGSIAQITPDLGGCVASTGFAVLRNISPNLDREYLWSVLRSRMCLKQMLQRASGGNYPAITEPELAKILIPVPSSDVQKTIAAEALRRREEARRLRAEAEAGWQAAKRWFEEQLLGTEKS